MGEQAPSQQRAGDGAERGQGEEAAGWLSHGLVSGSPLGPTYAPRRRRQGFAPAFGAVGSGRRLRTAAKGARRRQHSRSPQPKRTRTFLSAPAVMTTPTPNLAWLTRWAGRKSEPLTERSIRPRHLHCDHAQNGVVSAAG
jgi:hypothetical protein